MGARFCNNCGRPVTDRNPRCPTCRGLVGGASPATELMTVVAVRPDIDDLPVPPPLAGFATLVVPSGSLAGSRYILEPGETTLGRDVDSGVFLDDVTVSRSHARVRGDDGRFVVEDLGSLNGTYLNGTLIDRAELVNRDELRIGKFKLVFLDDPAG